MGAPGAEHRKARSGCGAAEGRDAAVPRADDRLGQSVSPFRPLQLRCGCGRSSSRVGAALNQPVCLGPDRTSCPARMQPHCAKPVGTRKADARLGADFGFAQSSAQIDVNLRADPLVQAAIRLAPKIWHPRRLPCLQSRLPFPVAAINQSAAIARRSAAVAHSHPPEAALLFAFCRGGSCERWKARGWSHGRRCSAGEAAAGAELVHAGVRQKEAKLAGTIASALGLAPATSAPGLGLAAATSAPGLGLAPSVSEPGLGCHICTGTLARPCHICAGDPRLRTPLCPGRTARGVHQPCGMHRRRPHAPAPTHASLHARAGGRQAR